MSKHLGNLTVTAENALSFPAITEFYGHLTIAAGATLIAPSLTWVRGWLTLHGRLDAPLLGKVDGWLTLHPDSALNAVNLTEVTRDVMLDGGSIDTRLGSVGSLTVKRDTSDLSWLVKVNTFLTVGALAHVSMPVLERVNGSITVKPLGALHTPELSHIGGYADIDEGATLVAPRFINA
jgi:hypothetical protein